MALPPARRTHAHVCQHTHTYAHTHARNPQNRLADLVLWCTIVVVIVVVVVVVGVVVVAVVVVVVGCWRSCSCCCYRGWQCGGRGGHTL